MRTPPPVSQLPRFPVVGGLALLAVGVTLAGWNDVDVSPLTMEPSMRRGELWRLVTPILPHVDAMHLIFNVYWLWALGTLVESTFGSARALGIILLLGVGSSAAEYTFLRGGVGLSGVGYGLFGLLWVLSRRDDRFRGAMDANTSTVFVFWFFLCIVLTVAGLWRVANIAHGVGALLGGLLGLAVAGGGRARGAWASLLAVLVVAFAAGAVYGRPYVNFTPGRAEDWADLGYHDLLKGRDEAAARHLRRAVQIDDREGRYWFNLGLAYARLGRPREAVDAHAKAAELEPGDSKYHEALEDARAAQASREEPE